LALRAGNLLLGKRSDEATSVDTSREQAWEQRERESAQAYAAFLAFRDSGPKRTVKGVAEALGKSRSLVAGWASRHDWRCRTRAWDREDRRRDEAVVREQQDDFVRRRLRRADMLGRIGLALLGRFFRRDPATGELQLSSQVKPRDAVPLLRLATELEERIDIARSEEERLPAEERLQGLDDRELERLIELAQAADETDEVNEEAGRDESASEDEA